jgi:adenosylmethionine-8-amino-7-oxononanoate aminotransferase
MQGRNSAASRDIAFHLHPYTHLKKHESEGPLVIAEGKGIYVYDENGKEYIEAWPVSGAPRSASMRSVSLKRRRAS